MAKALDALTAIVTKSAEVERQVLKSDIAGRKLDQTLIDSIGDLSDVNEKTLKRLVEALTAAKSAASTNSSDPKSSVAVQQATATLLKFVDSVDQSTEIIDRSTDRGKREEQRQLATQKQNLEFVAKEGATRYQRIAAEKELIAVQQQIAKKAVTESKTSLEKAENRFSSNQTSLNKAAVATAQLSHAQALASSRKLAEQEAQAQSNLAQRRAEYFSKEGTTSQKLHTAQSALFADFSRARVAASDTEQTLRTAQAAYAVNASETNKAILGQAEFERDVAKNEASKKAQAILAQRSAEAQTQAEIVQKRASYFATQGSFFQRLYAGQDELFAKHEAAKKTLADTEISLKRAQFQYAKNASEINKTGLQQALLTRDIASSEAKKTSHLLNPESAMLSNVIQKFKNVLAGFSLAVASRTAYSDITTARSTGGSNSIASGTDLTASVMGNYATAIINGITSRTLTEVRQSTRAAELSAGSQKKFDEILFKSVDGLYDITASRDEAVQIRAGIMSAGQEVGISAPASGEMLKGLSEQFGKLSRLTGQSAVSIAKMTEGIIKDTEQRDALLSMGEKQKSLYILEQIQRIAQYKQAGYTLEQAQELIKIQAAERNKKSIDKYKSHYSALQAREMLVGQLQGHGPEGQQRASQVSSINRKIKDLDAYAATNKFTADSVEGRKYKSDRAELEGKLAEHVSYLKGQDLAASGTMSQGQPIVDLISEALKRDSPGYTVTPTGAKNDDQTAKKANEKNANENSTVINTVTTLVDRVNSLLTSPLVQGIGGALVATSTLAFHAMAMKYMMGKMGIGAMDVIKGLLGRGKGGARAVWGGIKAAGGGLMRGAAWAGRGLGTAAMALAPSVMSAAPSVMSAAAKAGAGIAAVGSKAIGATGALAASAGGGLAKVATGSMGKSLIKKIPIIGALAGLGFGINRLLSGDFTGAALEIGGGLAGTLPGAGTALSIGADVALAGHDYSKAPKDQANVVNSTMYAAPLLGVGATTSTLASTILPALGPLGMAIATLTHPTPTTTQAVEGTGTLLRDKDGNPISPINKPSGSTPTEVLTAQVVKLIDLFMSKTDPETAKEMLNEYKRNGSNSRISAGLYSMIPAKVPS
jgi:hypothetical protein